MCASLFDLVRAGRHDEAKALQRRLTPLAAAVTGGFGIPGLKLAMQMAGYVGGEVRRPVAPGQTRGARRDQRGCMKNSLARLASAPGAGFFPPPPFFFFSSLTDC